jgi:hypothetical protein
MPAGSGLSCRPGAAIPIAKDATLQPHSRRGSRILNNRQERPIRAPAAREEHATPPPSKSCGAGFLERRPRRPHQLLTVEVTDSMTPVAFSSFARGAGVISIDHLADRLFGSKA